jgi:osmoprotectant transport system permease protein
MSSLAYGLSRWVAAPADGPGNPWFSWRYVQENGSRILEALQQHSTLTAEAVALAAVVALPLAVLAYWFRPLTGPILALSGVLYTIPSLALLSFVAPLVGTTKVTSVLIALVLYALLVIVRNTLAGLTQVPAEVREAAQGMGWPVRPVVARGAAAGVAGHHHRPAARHGLHGGARDGRRADRQGRAG